MQLNFQQGIVTYPIKNGRQTFLIRNGQYVSLQTLDGDTTITFAHGHNNYLYTESANITNAWGPLTTGIDYWLYWDINTLTGQRTFGFTAVQPVFSIEELKPIGVLDLHWFDTTNKKMFVYQTDGWREVIRVFAAKATDTSFFPVADNSRTQPFIGTQVGLKGFPITADYIKFDSTDMPIRRIDGLLYTDQKTAVGTSNPVTPTRYESNILIGYAAVAVTPFQIVKFDTLGNLVAASYNDIQDTILNITMSGGTGKITLCQHGIVTNPAWTFTNVGAVLWINNIGELVDVDPNTTDPITYPIAKAPVARVLAPTSIFFDVGMGGTGSDGNFGEDPPFSSTTDYGIGKLSLSATNPTQPIVAGTNDPRLIPYEHPLTHPSSIITTDAFGFLTGANLTTQLQELADRTLDSLINVSASTPSIGQGLQWNGSSWVNASYPSVQYLDDLVDVALSSPVSGQILGTTGSVWVDTTRNLTLTSNVTGTGTQNSSGVINISTTLATVNSNVGTFGNDTAVSTFTVNGKGLVTAAGSTAISYPVGGSGTVTSVDANGGTTGFTFTGGPATLGVGVLVMNGTLNISNGGTSATIANTAFNNLAPLQTGFGGNIDTGVAWLCGYGLYAGANAAGNNNLSSPIQLSDTSWSSLACGYDHNAAIKPDGTLWTWGFNDVGQLGHGTLFKTQVPSNVGNLGGWAQVSCGYTTTAAIRSDNTLWTWGQNNSGELGLGDTIRRSSPVQVGALTDWSYVSIGSSIMGAVKTTGTLWMCGYNLDGQLGDGTTIDKSSPVQIGALTDWSRIACSYNETVALKTDGTIWGWGRNLYGMLADGTTTAKSSPIQIGIDNDWVEISCGYGHIGARKSNGTIWTWGRNTTGQLGLGDGISRSSPVQVGSATDWVQIRCSNYNTYALKSDGTAWGWGEGTSGQLGNGDTLNKSSPTQIQTYNDWTTLAVMSSSVAFGGLRTITHPGKYFLQTDGNNTSWALPVTPPITQPYIGNLWSWGENGDYELNNGTTVDSSSPVQIGALTTWAKVASGRFGTTAIKTDGTLWAWGRNTLGRIGDGTTVDKSSPIQIGALTDWSYVAQSTNGAYTVAAIKTNGTLWTWGDNTVGQLGLGDIVHRSSPVQVGSDTDWSTVSVGGGSYMMAIKTNGTLWAWGNNGGELGDGTTIDKSSPVQIGALTNWSIVSAGSGTTAAVKTDGTLWTWGSNSVYGMLGIGIVGAGTNVSSPVQVGALTTWANVSCGYSTVGAIKTDGTLWTWGDNTVGQLGLGDIVHRSSPVQVGALTNWLDISTGSDITQALKTDGTMWFWGREVGTAFFRSSPIQLGIETDWIALPTDGAALTLSGIRGSLAQPPLNVLPISNGGTGEITATAAINALVPSQVGQANKALTFDGTTISWLTASGT